VRGDAASADGVLTVQFDNGFWVEALPDDRYESWSVIGPEGTIQCLPGGEIGSW
jgi:hypothetical protein